MDPSLNDLRFIDSHAHINLLPDVPQVLSSKIPLMGIKWVLVPGFDLHSSQEAVSLSKTVDWVIPAVGIHPHDAFPGWEPSLSVIRKMASDHLVAGIGEIGLDGIRSESEPIYQQKLLEEQLQIARENKLPVIIHNREQDREIDAILDNFSDIKGILHCYSSQEELALKKIHQGWLISFSLNITYPKSGYLRELIKKIPINSILLETDSPYLPPLDDRGKRNNTPLNIVLLYEWVSQWLGFSLEEVCDNLYNNFTNLFSAYLVSCHD